MLVLPGQMVFLAQDQRELSPMQSLHRPKLLPCVQQLEGGEGQTGCQGAVRLCPPWQGPNAECLLLVCCMAGARLRAGQGMLTGWHVIK